MTKRAIILFFFTLTLVLTAFILPNKAMAAPCCQCLTAPDHDGSFTKHKTWLHNEFYEGKFLPTFRAFSAQLTLMQEHQSAQRDRMLDARMALETADAQARLRSVAYRDMQPGAGQSLCSLASGGAALAATHQDAQRYTQTFTQGVLSQERLTGLPADQTPEETYLSAFVLNCNDDDNNDGQPFCQGDGQAFSLASVFTGSDTIELIEEDGSGSGPHLMLASLLTPTPATAFEPGSLGDPSTGEFRASAIEPYIQSREISAQLGPSAYCLSRVLGLRAPGPDPQEHDAAQMAYASMNAHAVHSMGIPQDQLTERPSWLEQMRRQVEYISHPSFVNADTPATVARIQAAVQALNNVILAELMRSQECIALLTASQLHTAVMTEDVASRGRTLPSDGGGAVPVNTQQQNLLRPISTEAR